MADQSAGAGGVVTRALIPCGGKGTRMSAVSGAGPKEMVPVGGMPIVERVARECGASGVTDLLIVLAPGKEAIAEHLSKLAGSDGFPLKVSFVVQDRPRGLADAIRLGRHFAAGEPLAVALPDNLFVGERPALQQVIDGYQRATTNVVAVVEIRSVEAERRGATPVVPGRLVGQQYRIDSIPDKGASSARFDTGGAASAFTAVGRYVFLPDVFGAIDEVERRLSAGAELDDVPLMQLLLARGQLVGHNVLGKFLDVGIPAGYAEADELLSRSRDSP